MRTTIQVLDHYMPSICNVTSHNCILTIEILPPSSCNQPPHQKLADDTDLDFSKASTEYIEKNQYQDSQRTNSIITNGTFSVIYSCVSILETGKTFQISPPQTSRLAIVKRENILFQRLLDLILEAPTDIEVSHINKIDLQRNFAWFVIGYFQIYLGLVTQAGKKIGP